MSTVPVTVGRHNIDEAPGLPNSAGGWAAPVESALAELFGWPVDIDGGGPDGPCVATIGQGQTVLVLDLPDNASAWLDRRWNGEGPGEPFTFELEIEGWLLDMIREAF